MAITRLDIDKAQLRGERHGVTARLILELDERDVVLEREVHAATGARADRFVAHPVALAARVLDGGHWFVVDRNVEARK